MSAALYPSSEDSLESSTDIQLQNTDAPSGARPDPPTGAASFHHATPQHTVDVVDESAAAASVRHDNDDAVAHVPNSSLDRVQAVVVSDAVATTATTREDTSARTPPSEQLSPPAPRKLGLSDFVEGKLLGTGSYSTVRLCTRDGKPYAMKVMEKRLILKERKEKFAKTERDILNLLSHPNIVGMHWCFQDEYSLFFVLDYCSGGELYQQLRELGTLSLQYGAFVLAEIVSALSHIHGHGIIHRDLKPENILFNSAGRIKISDFGTACHASDDALRKTFAGTAQYVSPEMLNSQDCCLSSDLWALGCIVYQLFAGKLLFNGDSEFLTFQLIVAEPIVISFPDFFPPAAQQLVQDLVIPNPGLRLGVRADGTIDYSIIRSHPFFASIDWDNLHKTSPPAPAPLVPRDLVQPQVEAQDTANDAEKTDFNQAEEDIIEKNTQRFVRFLLPGERVMFCSNFKKKLVWGLFLERDRTLVLTDTPRLIYTDPATNVFKGCPTFYSRPPSRRRGNV
jgi:serine/threonine protein kinase